MRGFLILILILILILFLVFSTPALAQFGETVVVTAGAFPAPLDELAAQASVLTAEQLEDRKITSVDEAIRQTASAIVLRSGTPGKVSSLFLRGAESDQALILLNGVPVSNSAFSGYNYGDLLTAGISRIEVVRGPYSALYGSEALSGVVSLFTGGRDRDAVRLSFAGGGDGLAEGDFSLDRDRFHLSLARHMEDGRLPNDGWAQTQGTFTYDADSWGLTLVGRDGEVNIPINAGMPSPERRQRTREYTAALPFRIDLTSGWKAQSLAGYTQNTLLFKDPQDPYGYTWGDTDASRLFFKTTVQSTGEGWKTAFGLEARRDRVTDTSVFGANLDGKSTSDGALFLEQTGWLGALGVRAGLRFDRHSEFGSTLNPKLSLYLPAGKIRLHVQAGTAFRAPSMGELYFPYSGNPDLRPERSRSAELGISGPDWALSAFESRYTNLIEFNYAAYTFGNAGKSRIRGLEFQVGGAIGPARMDLNATWLDARNTSTGEALLRRPRLSGSWTLSLPLHGGFRLSASGLYVGKRKDIDAVTFARVETDSFYRQDLIMAFDRPDLLSPYVKVENLLNSNYEEIAGYPALGLRLSAGLRWEMDFHRPQAPGFRRQGD
jgi:vitamin B12 transporter